MARLLFIISLCFCLLHVCNEWATATGTNKIKVYFNTPVNTSVSTGTNAVYLNNTLDDTLVAYINRAKYSIDVAVFNYVQSVSYASISTAINNAYLRGVKVRWIYDGSSSNTGVSSLNSGIKRLGSPTSASYGIMHNKFMIIDANSANVNDPIVWTGSTNWNLSQFRNHYNNVIIIQDKNLALAYTTEFNEMWGSTGLTPSKANSKFGPDKTDNTQHIFTIDGITVECYFTPSDSTNKHILDFIESADSQLYFGMYTFTHTTDANAIVNRKNAGVYTAGIIDQYSTSYGAYPILSSGLGNMLIVDSVFELYHNKFAMNDVCNLLSDPQVLTGSHNWTFGADIYNDENTLIVHDATITNLYYQSFYQNFIDMGGSLAANHPLSPVISGNLSICMGSSTILNTGNYASYRWSPGNQTNQAITASSSGIYSVTVSDAYGCKGTASATLSTHPCTASLNLKLFIEGYYAGNGQMRDVLLKSFVPSAITSQTDTILVALRNAATPTLSIDSGKTILMTNGSASIPFNNIIIGQSYWITVKHRSAVQTWSAAPVTFTSPVTSYDFTTDSTKAYAKNMRKINGTWVFYNSDINQDGNTDLIDFPTLDIAVASGIYGYYKEDLNGDGNVDLIDFPVLDLNIASGTSSRHP